jgi:hypothetical protein
MDVSSSDVTFTRHARRKSIELFTCCQHHQGRIAFLFSGKTAPHFARMFFASLGRLSFERDFLHNRAHAMD